MTETRSMGIVNQRCDELLKAILINDLTIMDLQRLSLRFQQISALIDNNISSLQKDLGGDDNAIKSP